MKKKLPVMTVAARDEAARLAELPAEATFALPDLASAIKDGLMAFCCAAGLAVVAEIMQAEMTAKAGPKGRHDPERTATRNGTAPGSVVLGGRTVPLRRPRATKAGGGEVHLDSYDAFNVGTCSASSPSNACWPAWRRDATSSSPSRSAKSSKRSPKATRTLPFATLRGGATEKLAELLARDLSVHDAAVLMIDGIIFYGCCCVVALVITTDGTKIPVGVWEGDTENTTVVKHLLADLVERGLRLRDGYPLGDRRVQGARRRGSKHVFGTPCRRAKVRSAQATRRR